MRNIMLYPVVLKHGYGGATTVMRRVVICGQQETGYIQSAELCCNSTSLIVLLLHVAIVLRDGCTNKCVAAMMRQHTELHIYGKHNMLPVLMNEGEQATHVLESCMIVAAKGSRFVRETEANNDTLRPSGLCFTAP
jgi:hypothetical protein